MTLVIIVVFVLIDQATEQRVSFALGWLAAGINAGLGGFTKRKS